MAHQQDTMNQEIEQTSGMFSDGISGEDSSRAVFFSMLGSPCYQVPILLNKYIYFYILYNI